MSNLYITYELHHDYSLQSKMLERSNKTFQNINNEYQS
jgi:hypothetical protein